ncbi:MAG: tyrosine-type recombinase/integrase [Gammaproteobacteria bacterium]|nr:tyrosine-type recombinase/integrase [Gammaproteobacteria bacterium]
MSLDKGFMLRVFPSGRLSYMCEYARGRRIAIGDAKVITVAQAREKAKQILGDMARGIDPKKKQSPESNDKQGITFQQFFNDVYAPWLQANKPDSYRNGAGWLNGRFMEFLSEKRLDELNAELLEKWRIERLQQDKVKPATVNKEIIMLKTLLSRAQKWGFITEHPLANFEMSKLGDTTRVRFLSKEEYNRLIQALDNEEERLRSKRDKGNQWRTERGYNLLPDLRQQAFASDLKPKVLLSLSSGMRRCELRRLRREKHIDHQRQGLYLTPEVTKTKRSRFIPLDERSWQVLVRWLNQTCDTYGDSGPVFPGKDGKSEFNNMNKSWKRLLKLANIDHFTWHDMRHDYASQLVMAGVDLNTVRELLGHTDIKMTLRYAHLAPEHKAEAVRQLAKHRENLLDK